MRLVSRLAPGVISLVLLAPLARADDATTSPPASISPPAADAVRSDAARSKIPLRVVRVMPESRQALLFDRTRATHVLVEIGAKLDGYTVADIDDDSVTLVRDGREVVLMAPLPGDRPIDRTALSPRSLDGAAPTSPPVRAPDGVVAPPARSSEAAASAGVLAAPVDPYGDTAIRVAVAPGAPASSVPSSAPAGSEGGIRVVSAPSLGPSAPGEGGIRVASAPATSAEPAGAPRSEVQTVSGAPAAPIRAASAAGIQPASVARADQAPLDAHALADVFASAHAGRCPQSPCQVANPPTRPSEVRVTSAAPEGPAPRSVSLRDDAGSPRSDDRSELVAIARGDLDRALADFAALSAGIRARFSTSGVIVDSVGDGTIFQRAGLRAGDVITTVDGQRLHTLDDAANLYARASATKAMTAQILRAGRPATLRVVIQ